MGMEKLPRGGGPTRADAIPEIARLSREAAVSKCAFRDKVTHRGMTAENGDSERVIFVVRLIRCR